LLASNYFVGMNDEFPLDILSNEHYICAQWRSQNEAEEVMSLPEKKLAKVATAALYQFSTVRK